MTKLSPREILKTALESFCYDKSPEQIEQLMQEEKGSEFRLKAIAFMLKELAAWQGEVLTTMIEEDEIYFYKNQIMFYIIEDQSFSSMKELYFEVVLHWGSIQNVIENLNIGKEKSRVQQQKMVV